MVTGVNFANSIVKNLVFLTFPKGFKAFFGSKICFLSIIKRKKVIFLLFLILQIFGTPECFPELWSASRELQSAEGYSGVPVFSDTHKAILGLFEQEIMLESINNQNLIRHSGVPYFHSGVPKNGTRWTTLGAESQGRKYLICG